MLIHCVTVKGKGYAPAERADDKYHAVAKFNVATGAQVKPMSNAPSYTAVFAQHLAEVAARDPRIVAIAAAMPGGTGLDTRRNAFRAGDLMWGLPSSMARPLRRVWRHRGCGRSARFIPVSCKAARTRSCMTWPCKTCPSALPSTAPGWSAKTAHPMPGRKSVRSAVRFSSGMARSAGPKRCRPATPAKCAIASAPGARVVCVRRRRPQLAASFRASLWSTALAQFWPFQTMRTVCAVKAVCI